MSDIGMPKQIAVRSLLLHGEWNVVEVWQEADIAPVPLPHGTYYGLLTEYIVQSKRDDFLRVGASPRHRLSDGEREKLLQWLAWAGFQAFIEVKKGTLQPQHAHLLDIWPEDIGKDPQQRDMAAYRRRCRWDILRFMHDRLSNTGASLKFSVSSAAESPLLTRLYHDADLPDAIRYWEQRGIVRLDLGGEDLVIDVNRDEEISNLIAEHDWEETVAEVANSSHGQSQLTADVFICHAWEDKDSFVRSLAAALREHLQVWYDEYSLTLGDRLRQKIDQGLLSSKFGIVVLSKDFFAKNWPQYELDGLVQREMSGGTKVILPIWHGVTKEDVEAYSPSLAGRVAATSSQPLSEIVSQILHAVSVPH